MIHAGKSLEKDMLEKLKNYNLNCSSGAIIGEAEITDCILVDKGFDEKLNKIDPLVYSKNSHVAKYAWHLENIKKYDRVIYAKGKLGLWNYEMK